MWSTWKVAWILTWTQIELDAMDRRVRTLLTAYSTHHQCSAMMRLYTPRVNGDHGFFLYQGSIWPWLNIYQPWYGSLRNYSRELGEAWRYFVHAKWRAPVVRGTYNRKNIYGRERSNIICPTGPYLRKDVNLLAAVNWLVLVTHYLFSFVRVLMEKVNQAKIYSEI